VSDEIGPIDILVNNAGIGHVGTIEQTAASDLDRLYGVNVRGMFNVTKAFIGSMPARRTGRCRRRKRSDVWVGPRKSPLRFCIWRAMRLPL
jgi:NAD(P)-dependent dehydrogenase (short-subunit alcohol dehydrogenase family)